MDFKLVSGFKPSAAQREVIGKLVKGLGNGFKRQTLLGVTGSGKTFTMANIVAKVQKPSLIMSPNKTLAAQLYSEFREFFPENAVEYFVSYYDYYQPEAYLPASDTYIEKDADINVEIEKLRHRATASLLDRQDTLVVSTVSAIYGLGSPDEYRSSTLYLEVGSDISRDMLIRELVSMHYERNDTAVSEGRFRVRGANIDIFPPYGGVIFRVKANDKIESIKQVHVVTKKTLFELDFVRIHPAVHYILPDDKKIKAMDLIRDEMSIRIGELEAAGKLLEANRLKQRTNYDIELISTLGYCKGIENYSRHLEGRKAGVPPNTLLDFFPSDWLCFMDESHIAVPQVRGMFKGDKSRKETLIDYGFRLPSALDNRPLKYSEFDKKLNQVIYVSATPADYEMKNSAQIVEQVIRPTGLVDPEVEVRPAKDQIKDLEAQINARVEKRQRVLVTALTKRMSEDLADYLEKKGYAVKYLHSEIDTLDRVDILRELRKGTIDVIVGVNLLREGLDLPEVSLVAILDADQEGFLRSETSLVQTIGRCSRNVDGKVLLYADKITGSMGRALAETERRRKLQIQYNKRHNITPKTITKKIHERIVEKHEPDVNVEIYSRMPVDEIKRLMREAADRMDFEQAIMFRNMLEAEDGN